VDTLGIRWTRAGRHLDAGQGDLLPSPAGRPYQVAGVSGACLYVTRAAHDRVVSATGEFFDEDFFAYREDAELGHRAALLGVTSYVVPSATGRHVRRLRGTERGIDPDIDRLGVRNRLLLAFKYGARRPGWPLLAFARDAVVVVAAFTTERSSLPGVVEAWRLRPVMRAKRRRLRALPEAPK
jgi:GT2 family glycosyltransferase